jgi:hypothetical protein
MSQPPEQQPLRVHVPADTERPDRVLAGLTGRQVAILAGAGLLLWLTWLATRPFLPPVVFLAGASVVAAVAFGVAVGRRDGLPLDVWILQALRYHRTPKVLVPAPEGVTAPPPWIRAHTAVGGRIPLPAPLRLPARGVDDTGVLDLGPDGQTAVVEADTVNFALRTPAEQEALVGAFAAWLHALDGPAQILVRAEHADLHQLADQLTVDAPSLPDPGLEAAAREHAAYLTDLGGARDLLRRQVLVCLRDPARTGTVHRWADQAAQALAAAEVSARPLDAATALTRVLEEPALNVPDTGTGRWLP